MPRGSLLGCVVVALAGCSQSSTSATTVAPTLPGDFSVPAISIPPLSTVAATVNCMALQDRFAALALDSGDIRAELETIVNELRADAPADVAAALSNVVAVTKTLPSDATSADVLANPDMMAELSTVRSYLQGQGCG